MICENSEKKITIQTKSYSYSLSKESIVQNDIDFFCVKLKKKYTLSVNFVLPRKKNKFSKICEMHFYYVVVACTAADNISLLSATYISMRENCQKPIHSMWATLIAARISVCPMND